MEKIALTNGQQSAFENIKKFLASNERVFILRGYAGTGKTTLVREVIAHFKSQQQQFKLLASTGRAAKIMTNVTGALASTVHSLIYKYNDFNQDLETIVKQREETGVDKSGQLYLTFGLASLDNEAEDKCIYIIDEASMISDTADKNITQAFFGSGRLLYDLLHFDSNGKFIFVGDDCQLPPIAQAFSPALSVEYFKQEYGYNAFHSELTQIMRQAQGNDIVRASHNLRNLARNFTPMKWGKLPLKGYRHITLYKDSISLMSAYIANIKKNGFNNATLLCRSNKTCNDLAMLRTYLPQGTRRRMGTHIY